MSAHAASRRSSAPARRRGATARRRLAVLALAGLVGAGAVALMPNFQEAAKEITLPLRHEDIIRQQSSRKNLDPALVAGVIYAESKFVDQTSHAGARGLMQITPETARGIAQRSGGTAFTVQDLADPQVNIAYGTFYLRTLLDRYDDDVVLALAAYNAGQGNVDRWIAERGRTPRVSEIPFPETRAYVERVIDARAGYRSNYASELGL